MMFSWAMKTVSTMWLLMFIITLSQANEDIFEQGLPDTCLEGPLHKDEPGPESDEFLECRSWKNQACCNINVSHEIHHNRAVGLYNYHWDRCGDLSPECEQYLKHEECFYQCEPMLKHFERPGQAGYIRDVPICKSFCDRWFEACKNDMTCVEDWLGDWSYEDNGLNHCPTDSNCVTFTEMYGDAKGMCNKMWGDAFYYEESDTLCMVMQFDPDAGENPNLRGNVSLSSRLQGLTVTLWLTLASALIIGIWNS